MPSTRQSRGRKGEFIAQQYLKKKGYRSLERNWHSRYGEIDLIMKDADELVFVEVKLRATDRFGHPEEMVSQTKMEKLKKTASDYLRHKKYYDLFWRFDIVAITEKESSSELMHFKDVLRD